VTRWNILQAVTTRRQRPDAAVPVPRRPPGSRSRWAP